MKDNLKDGGPEFKLAPMDRLVAIDMESQVVRKKRLEPSIARIVNRYDFNFLLHWAEKGILKESTEPSKEGEGK